MFPLGRYAELAWSDETRPSEQTRHTVHLKSFEGDPCVLKEFDFGAVAVATTQYAELKRQVEIII